MTRKAPITSCGHRGRLDALHGDDGVRNGHSACSVAHQAANEVLRYGRSRRGRGCRWRRCRRRWGPSNTSRVEGVAETEVESPGRLGRHLLNEGGRSREPEVNGKMPRKSAHVSFERGRAEPERQPRRDPLVANFSRKGIRQVTQRQTSFARCNDAIVARMVLTVDRHIDAVFDEGLHLGKRHLDAETDVRACTGPIFRVVATKGRRGSWGPPPRSPPPNIRPQNCCCRGGNRGSRAREGAPCRPPIADPPWQEVRYPDWGREPTN